MKDATAPEPAPFHDGVATAAPNRRTRWVAGADGLRLRATAWAPEGARGTVLLFQGRTEYSEKYSDAAANLARRGFASATLDWRGQGLSPRTATAPMIGHVRDFRDFQIDVDALTAFCEGEGLPRPWSLLAHSMGGLIGLRALLAGLAVRRAVFSAPMWGLPLAPHRRLLAWGATSIGSVVGLGGHGAPGAGKVADPANAPFEDNLLTNDREMFAWMKRQISEHPELALGGPSVDWVFAALREMHATARMAAPDVPCLTLLGSDEDVVSADAIHVRMAAWPGGALEMVEGARHEVLMEDSATRNRLYDRIAAHLDD